MQEVKRIPLEGVHNTRDMGGYQTAAGRSIKPHRLIRSGELYHLTERDKEILTGEYKLTTIVDFRTGIERKEKPDPELVGVTYIPNPILDEKVLGITRERETDSDMAEMVLNHLKGSERAGIEYMEDMYSNLITNSFCKKQYAGFFGILLNQEEGAVLWHCTAGKDRVGMGTALLLTALGVSREQIIADYMKVNEFAADGINHMVQEIMNRTGDLQTAEHLRTLFSVRESYIETVFANIEKQYGSMKEFLKEEMSIYGDTAETLKNKYLQ